MPIATLLLWFAFGGRKRGEAVWRIALVAAAASMVTHPIAWWANRSLVGTLGMTERYTLIELAVVVVEAVIYRGAIATRTVAAGVTSLVANAASFGFGLWRMLAGG